MHAVHHEKRKILCLPWISRNAKFCACRASRETQNSVRSVHLEKRKIRQISKDYTGSVFVSTPVYARFQSSTASLNSHQPVLVYAEFQVSAASLPDQEPVYLLFVIYEMSWYVTFT